MFTGIQELDKAIFSLITTGIFALLGALLKSRPRLRIYTSHNFTFRINLPEEGKNLLIQTRNLHIKNFGRVNAENVEVYHAFRPPNFQIWPAISYSEDVNSESYHIIKIPKIRPKEDLVVEQIYIGDQVVPTFLRVVSDAGEAVFVGTRPTIIPPKHIISAVYFLMFMGASFIVYILVSIYFSLKS